MYSKIIIQSSQTSYPLHPQKEVQRIKSCCKGDKVKGGEGEGVSMGTIQYTHAYSPVQMKYSNWVFSACLQIGRTVFFQTMSSSEICSKIYELKYAMWLKHETPIYGKN